MLIYGQLFVKQWPQLEYKKEAKKFFLCSTNLVKYKILFNCVAATCIIWLSVPNTATNRNHRGVQTKFFLGTDLLLS